jgi:hypothetical protein
MTDRQRPKYTTSVPTLRAVWIGAEGDSMDDLKAHGCPPVREVKGIHRNLFRGRFSPETGSAIIQPRPRYRRLDGGARLRDAEMHAEHVCSDRTGNARGVGGAVESAPRWVQLGISSQ